jgi:hypothetical protein
VFADGAEASVLLEPAWSRCVAVHGPDAVGLLFGLGAGRERVPVIVERSGADGDVGPAVPALERQVVRQIIG